jgi:hypothetical protein
MMSAGDSSPNLGDGSSALRVCARCGASFSCGAALFCDGEVGSCWCESVAVRPAALTRLREQFADCLCEGCLKEEAGK